MAIYFSRAASIAPGKLAEAMAFAQDMVKLAKGINGVELILLVPLGGNPNRVAWVSRYDDLADFDAKRKKIMSHPEYLAALPKAAQLFTGGSVHDELWESVA
jgi:hypothetical protein